MTPESATARFATLSQRIVLIVSLSVCVVGGDTMRGVYNHMSDTSLTPRKAGAVRSANVAATVNHSRIKTS